MQSKRRFPVRYSVSITNKMMRDIKKAMKLPAHKGQTITDLTREALEAYSIEK